MRKFRKPLSIVLVLMLALSMFSMCATAGAAEIGGKSQAGDTPANHNGTITVTSNVGSSVSVNYDYYNDAVTVTYKLQSTHKIVNTQSYVEYDPTVLQLGEVDLEVNLPKLNATGSAVMNVEESGYVYINASNINLYNFTNPGIYYTQTFNIIGTGDTTVNLNMEILTGSDQADYTQATDKNDITLVDSTTALTNEFTFTAEADLSGEEPTTAEPTTEEPTTAEPTTEEPTTEEPTTAEPTEEPTTAAPTTEAPTESTTVPQPEAVDRDGCLIVADDFNLVLNPANGTRVVGEIYLKAGEYKFRVQKDRVLMGYNSSFTDNTPKGLTFNSKFKAQTTLTATGGTYKFQFDTNSNALIVKKADTTTPPAYLTGDLHTILKPVAGKEDSMASGSLYVAPGTYEFKVVNGESECGYNTTINDSTGTSMLSVNPKYKANMKLVATGGVYTFTLFTKTNKFKVAYVNDSDESKTDVHIAGGIKLVLNDNNGESNIATATAAIAADTYQIKVYNYGVIYTTGENLKDSGSKNLKSFYTTPLNFTATGGTYTFTFNKTTGKLTVQKLAEVISVQ